MRNLITYEDISRLARPCTTDRDMAEAMIAEAQRVELKPRLGDVLYLRILEDADDKTVYDGGSADFEADTIILGAADSDFIIGGESAYSYASEATTSPRYDLLLNGGIWTTACGEQRLLTGVKTALAYYTLARIVRDGNIQTSTYGSVVKDDQYSAEAGTSERQRQYRELFSQADAYMAEAVNYLASNCRSFPEYKVAGRMRSNRTTIRIIGK
jgi:hypothetical protein